MKNTIAERVADFLKGYPPFNVMDANNLQTVAEQVLIVYCEKGKTIFEKDELRHEYFYVVHKGAVTLLREEENTIAKTLDTCDEGDIFGLRPLIAAENYVLSAKATEESILYGIPIDIFQPIAEKNLQVGYFLVESFASNTRNPYSTSHRGHLYSEVTTEASDETLYEIQPAKIIKNVITAGPDDSIRSVAKKMNSKQIGSIVVVDDDHHPIGIVTDKDFRSKVVTGKVPINDKIAKIMSLPVICYKKGITIAQAQMAMTKYGITYLCITKDGTPKSKLCGIISSHDLIVSQGNSPSIMMRAINRAEKTKELKHIRSKVMLLLEGYMRQNVPMRHVSRIITELNDACIKRCIALSIEKLDQKPPVKFAWLSLGSQGRKEQLLHTDQDNALVFENVSEDKLEDVRAYFLALSGLVTKRLFKIGYEYCPAEMMANNPKWCLSLKEWKAQFTQWITNPGNDEILLSSIFFDYDISYGEAALAEALADHIFDTVENNSRFFALFGASALRSPSPVGFFRQFLVEQDGAHKDYFDLKKRALMPLVDAGRILILSKKIKHINNTSDRFQKLAELESENAEIFKNCSYAVKALLKFRTKQGLRNNDSGRYIDLKLLSKEEKIKLKRTFKAINQVQELIKVRFKLGNIL